MQKIISEIVKENRKKLNLSQRELAKLTGLSYSYIAKIENGSRKKPSLDILYKLSNVLNIDFIKLVKSSNYSNEEINRLIYFSNEFNHINLNELSKETNIDKDTLKECLTINDDNDTYYDIYKVLNAYRKGKIDESQAVQLIFICKTILIEDKIYYKTSKGIITL